MRSDSGCAFMVVPLALPLRRGIKGVEVHGVGVTMRWC